eukprot:GHVL01031301.1.p1 GENE.GHVL01031301.1~~GHVL01031301.1.p1  ORF type:complete len:240 (+),score=49.13 GHVL01031301.1:49-768(+)
MGGDGGSIPKRIDLVREKGQKFIRNLGGMGYTPNTIVHVNDEIVDKMHLKRMRWETCAISQEALKKPIVACKLGLLYNKETVLTKMATNTVPASFAYIRHLKDLKDCKIEQSGEGHFVCPITLIELSGGPRACLNWNCGCVVSEKAMKNLSKKSLICVNCSAPHENEDIVNLNEDQEIMEAKRAIFLGEVKNKKRKKNNEKIEKNKKIHKNEEQSDTFKSLFKPTVSTESKNLFSCTAT